MLIVCPSCATTYSLTEAQLGRGRTLRCANCRHTWHATPDDAAEGGAAVAALPEPDLANAELQHDLGAVATVDAPAAPAAVADEGPRPTSRRPPPRPSRGRPRPGGGGLAAIAQRVKAAKPWQLALGGAAVALVAALVLREPLVRLAPQTARLFAAIGLPVNLRGLSFDTLHGEIIADKDQTILVVDGVIRNLRRRETTVPLLSLTLRGEDGGEVYSWTAEAPHAVLAAGEATPFRTRIVTPPLDGRDILVRFARNDDTASAGH